MNAIQENPKIVAGCGCCIPILLIIAVFMSLGSVGPIEYGLQYNRFNKEVSDTGAVKGGRHWIWPWGSFITFPAQAIKIEFSERQGASQGPLLNCRTNDGFTPRISIAFQYQLQKNGLSALYQHTGVTYEALFARVAKQAICGTTSHNLGSAFYDDRVHIQQRMLADLNSRISEYHADITSCQLLKIVMPDVWEQALIVTQVSKQQALTAASEQVATTVRANIGVMQAGYNNQVTVVRATATANATVTTRNAQAEALRRRINAEASALSNIKTAFDPELSTAGLVAYQKFFTMHQLSNATFMFGVPNAGVWIRPADPAPASAPHPSWTRSSPSMLPAASLHATDACKA